MKKILGLLVMMVLLALPAYSSDNSTDNLTLPNTFNSGTTISSSQMNENFLKLVQKINELQQKLLTGWERKEGTEYTCSNGTYWYRTVTCSEGKKVLGGGCYTSSKKIDIYKNYPSSDNKWQCGFECNDSTGTYKVFVICANIGEM